MVFAAFVLCVGAFKEGNQEIGFPFATASLFLGMELNIDAVGVCVTGVAWNMEDNALVVCVLGSDDRPKNDFDAQISFSGFLSKLNICSGCELFSVSSGWGVAGAVGKPKIVFDVLLACWLNDMIGLVALANWMYSFL